MERKITVSVPDDAWADLTDDAIDSLVESIDEILSDWFAGAAMAVKDDLG
jgi:hypothetical protein